MRNKTLHKQAQFERFYMNYIFDMVLLTSGCEENGICENEES